MHISHNIFVFGVKILYYLYIKLIFIIVIVPKCLIENNMIIINNGLQNKAARCIKYIYFICQLCTLV